MVIISKTTLKPWDLTVASGKNSYILSGFSATNSRAVATKEVPGLFTVVVCKRLGGDGMDKFFSHHSITCYLLCKSCFQ